MLSSLDRIDGLARHPKSSANLGLAPIAFGAKDPKPVFHPCFPDSTVS